MNRAVSISLSTKQWSCDDDDNDKEEIKQKQPKMEKWAGIVSKLYLQTYIH